ncbi:MAG TPA: nucleotide exchange factor GrpE [Tepidisphaeraceae bacterium]|jgi:molecular chaperone GrpE|nr:nucleotide exchange factor GrpE [Tepidisphaeraceae bacterium]
MSRIPINDENDRNEENDQQTGGDGNTRTAGQQAGTAAKPDSELDALRADRDSLYDRLARATAEFKNSQRRMQQDLDSRLQYANSSVIKTILPVIDNFERALAADPEKMDARSLLKGMQIVHDQLLSVLRQQEVEEIAPQPGTPFDPAKHEAIMQQDSQYKVPTVVQLLQKGYALHGRTLRPAQVAVSKGV